MTTRINGKATFLILLDIDTPYKKIRILCSLIEYRPILTLNNESDTLFDKFVCLILGDAFLFADKVKNGDFIVIFLKKERREWDSNPR